MAATTLATAKYVRDLAKELTQLAAQAGLGDVAFGLTIAVVEAERAIERFEKPKVGRRSL